MFLKGCGSSLLLAVLVSGKNDVVRSVKSNIATEEVSPMGMVRLSKASTDKPSLAATEPAMLWSNGNNADIKVPEAYGGGAPQMYGLDRCEKYRAAVPYEKRSWGVAGLQNTGTHALFQSVVTNCQVPKKLQTVGWQVPWGKHEFLHNTHLSNDTAKKAVETMAITLMKDPVMWMASTCSRPYFDVTFDDRNSATCPSPVSGMKVDKFGKADDAHESIMHLWSRWGLEYMDAEEPYSLMIRFEDLLFQPKATVEKVCGCLGFPMNPMFKILESDSKGYQGPNGHKYANRTLVLEKYTTKRNAMLNKLTAADHEFMNSVLDQTGGNSLASYFHYPTKFNA